MDALRRLIYRGERLSIYAYRGPGGEVPLLNAIDRLRRRYPHLREAYMTRWKRAADHGLEQMKADHYHTWTKKHDKRLAGTLLGAFKDLNSKTRVPVFADGPGVLVLTHLIEGKKEDAIKPKDRKDTLGFYDEYWNRKERAAAQRVGVSSRPKKRRRG